MNRQCGVKNNLNCTQVNQSINQLYNLYSTIKQSIFNIVKGKKKKKGDCKGTKTVFVTIATLAMRNVKTQKQSEIYRH